MKARFKRNAVVVTMALLVCAAAALNWKYTGEEAAKQAAGEGSDTKILGEAALVSGGEGNLEADEAAVYTGDDYFASARLTRQQARDNAISLLQEAAEQEGADAAVANEAAELLNLMLAELVLQVADLLLDFLTLLHLFFQRHLLILAKLLHLFLSICNLVLDILADSIRPLIHLHLKSLYACSVSVNSIYIHDVILLDFL